MQLYSVCIAIALASYMQVATYFNFSGDSSLNSSKSVHVTASIMLCCYGHIIVTSSFVSQGSLNANA